MKVKKFLEGGPFTDNGWGDWIDLTPDAFKNYQGLKYEINTFNSGNYYPTNNDPTKPLAARPKNMIRFHTSEKIDPKLKIKVPFAIKGVPSVGQEKELAYTYTNNQTGQPVRHWETMNYYTVDSLTNQGNTFSQAYQQARNTYGDNGTFTYNGKLYNTKNNPNYIPNNNLKQTISTTYKDPVSNYTWTDYMKNGGKLNYITLCKNNVID